MKVLVTGGAGFIGSHLISALLHDGCEVVCIDDFNDFYDPHIKRQNIQPFLSQKTFTLKEGDIRDKDFVEDVFSRHTFDHTIHLAARAGVRPSLENPALYVDVNIIGTYVLLEIVKKYSVKKVIFASSSSVYGNNTKVPFAEDDPVDFPISPYAVTKKTCELLCHTFHYLYAIDILCLRFFTVYGPRQRPEMAIHQCIDNSFNDHPMEMFGNGLTSRDYTYIDDIVRGICLAMECRRSYEIINLGNSHPIQLLDLIRCVERHTKKPVQLVRRPKQPGDVERTYADIAKARRLLGWKPSVDIEEGIRRTVKWYKEERV